MHDLQDLVPLMAYENPEESPLAHFLKLERRQQLAEDVNTELCSMSFC